MSVPVIQLRSRMGNPDALRGKVLTEADVTLLLKGDADVYKPDGTPLVMLRRRAIPKPLLAQAYPTLHELRKQKTDNRGAYAGATRTQAVFADGSLSKNSRTRDETGKRLLVASAVVGFYDRQGGRFPYCRQTAFASKEVELWSAALPMIEHVGQLFKKVAPTRWQNQMDECSRCPDYVIGSGPFTTLTVNNNTAPSATHTDKGDFKNGLGVISCVRRGSYEGAWLVFPEYGVGADLGDGDVIFFNSHDWHGVTDMEKMTEDYDPKRHGPHAFESPERITVVYYFRERMTECLPIAQELARAQARGLINTEGDDGTDQ